MELMKIHKMAQKSPEWHQKRKGVITGTSLKALMSSRKDTREDAIYELIAERLTVGVPEEYENAMDRGNRLEPEALAMFEFETGKVLETVGFAESARSRFIGYSPDSIVAGTDWSEDVEAKCPQGKNYVKMWLTNRWTDEYEWQLVHGFVVNPLLMKRYFILYNPDIPVHPFHVIPVTREMLAEQIAKAEAELDEVLPRLDRMMKEIIEF